MRLLLVKMSSLGDVIHTLPALVDARRALPALEVDWVVEEAFAEVPGWHAAVARTIPVALRRWRRSPLAAWRSGEWARFRTTLAARRYDLVLDAQGLLKSAFVARLVAAPRAGYDRASAREPLAACALDQRYAVARECHAIERTRALFAHALGYAAPAGEPCYGIERARLPAPPPAGGVLFLHGSSRADKCWPEASWIALGERVAAAGEPVLLPWGSEAERRRAERIAAAVPVARVLPRLALGELAALLSAVRAAVAVDTGLGHLAAALGTPCVSLYGPTRIELIGTRGAHQQQLRGAGGALAALPADTVWDALLRMGIAR